MPAPSATIWCLCIPNHSPSFWDPTVPLPQLRLLLYRDLPHLPAFQLFHHHFCRQPPLEPNRQNIHKNSLLYPVPFIFPGCLQRPRGGSALLLRKMFPSQSDNVSISGCRFCRLCRFKVPVRSYHCSYCDVCIEGYDHHCPWTSKCIGKNNLGRFYFFLFMTPVFIVYCSFVFGFTIQDNNMAQLQALSRH